MERKFGVIIVEVMDNSAIKSIVQIDGPTVVYPPIHNVDGANPTSTRLSILRQQCREETKRLNMSFHYRNHDLANEVLRRKKYLTEELRSRVS